MRDQIDLNNEILKEYQWWDYSHLLSLMHLWTKEASMRYSKDGNLVNSAKVSKTLKIVSELIVRINKDEYLDNINYVFKSKNKYFNSVLFSKPQATDDEVGITISKSSSKMRRQDIEMLFKLMAKHIESWWD